MTAVELALRLHLYLLPYSTYYLIYTYYLTRQLRWALLFHFDVGGGGGGVNAGAAAWSMCPLGSARGRPLRHLRARLAALVC